MLTVDIALPEVEELQRLIENGLEKGFLTYDEIVTGLEEVELTKEQVEDFYTYLIDHSIELVEGVEHKALPHEEPPPRGRQDDAEARPLGRAVPRLAAALPARDRQGAAPHRRPGGLAREAHRARRHGREAAHDRGEPAARRLDREGLSRPRPLVPRPDPGGLARADPRRREVRLPQGLQVLDLCDVVDPAGGHTRDRGQGAHDPDPRAHGREAEQGRAHRAAARPAAGPRARAGGDRGRARHPSRRGARDPAYVAAARSLSRSRSARTRTPTSAISSRTSRPSRRSTRRRSRSGARTSSSRCRRSRSASGASSSSATGSTAPSRARSRRSGARSASRASASGRSRTTR